MPTIDITISATSNAAQFRVTINNRAIRVNQGPQVVRLQTGREHVINWFVRGAQGDTYRVQITTPQNLRNGHNGRLDSSGIDAGQMWVSL